MARRTAIPWVVAAQLTTVSLVAGAPQNVQTPVNANQPSRLCNLPVPKHATNPPDGSAPVVLAYLLCFEKQGGLSMIEPQTYLYHIKLRPSEPSLNKWVTYDDELEALVRSDFRRLWDTNF